jgi:hypothetical protein
MRLSRLQQRPAVDTSSCESVELCWILAGSIEKVTRFGFSVDFFSYQLCVIEIEREHERTSVMGRHRHEGLFMVLARATTRLLSFHFSRCHSSLKVERERRGMHSIYHIRRVRFLRRRGTVPSVVGDDASLLGTSSGELCRLGLSRSVPSNAPVVVRR